MLSIKAPSAFVDLQDPPDLVVEWLLPVDLMISRWSLGRFVRSLRRSAKTGVKISRGHVGPT